jgi:hypothetical protein
MVIQTIENAPHWAYFIAIERDLAELSRYVEFDERNFKCFSIEIVKLLLSASAEVAVVCKQLCQILNRNPSKKGSLLSPASIFAFRGGELLASKESRNRNVKMLPRRDQSTMPTFRFAARQQVEVSFVAPANRCPAVSRTRATCTGSMKHGWSRSAIESFAVMEVNTPIEESPPKVSWVVDYGAEGAEEGLVRRWNLLSQCLRVISWVIAPAISALPNAKPVAGIRSIHSRAASIMP